MWPVMRALMLTAMGLTLAACSDFGQRIYTAHPYRAEQACVGVSIPIGAVQAEDLDSSCPPVCLFLDETLYVSEVCAPYPGRATVVTPEDSADCALAIDLLATEPRCEAAPAQPSDGGTRDSGPDDGSAAEP
jgi:hypothetical protein